MEVSIVGPTIRAHFYGLKDIVLVLQCITKHEITTYNILSTYNDLKYF